jgi:Outer membrane protein (OmpH-like).
MKWLQHTLKGDIHMRKFLAVALFLLLLQSVALAAGPAKVGIFDPEEVLRTSEPGQEAIKQFEAKMKPDSERIERQQKDFLKMQEDFQKQAFALAPEARQDKERELRRKEFELSEAVRMFQNAANREKSLKLQRNPQGPGTTPWPTTPARTASPSSWPRPRASSTTPTPPATSPRPSPPELNRAWKSRKK